MPKFDKALLKPSKLVKKIFPAKILFQSAGPSSVNGFSEDSDATVWQMVFGMLVLENTSRMYLLLYDAVPGKVHFVRNPSVAGLCVSEEPWLTYLGHATSPAVPRKDLHTPPHKAEVKWLMSMFLSDISPWSKLAMSTHYI